MLSRGTAKASGSTSRWALAPRTGLGRLIPGHPRCLSALQSADEACPRSFPADARRHASAAASSRLEDERAIPARLMEDRGRRSAGHGSTTPPVAESLTRTRPATTYRRPVNARRPRARRGVSGARFRVGASARRGTQALRRIAASVGREIRRDRPRSKWQPPGTRRGKRPIVSPPGWSISIPQHDRVGVPLEQLRRRSRRRDYLSSKRRRREPRSARHGPSGRVRGGPGRERSALLGGRHGQRTLKLLPRERRGSCATRSIRGAVFDLVRCACHGRRSVTTSDATQPARQQPAKRARPRLRRQPHS
jgi:hypothetical protein